MASEPLLEKRGAVINKKNLDSSIILPPQTLGTDQQVSQMNGANNIFQDLILASKQIDNTVVPLDGWVLTYDATSGKVKFKASTNTALSEVQFLASQAALGNLILVQGTVTGIGTITSYTPANGKTFTLYKASVSMKSMDLDNQVVSLINNATTRESHVFSDSSAAGSNNWNWNFATKGDQLIGTGALIYSLQTIGHSTAAIALGSIEGYIA